MIRDNSVAFLQYVFVLCHTFAENKLNIKTYENNEVFIYVTSDGSNECLYGKLWR